MEKLLEGNPAMVRLAGVLIMILKKERTSIYGITLKVKVQEKQ